MAMCDGTGWVILDQVRSGRVGSGWIWLDKVGQGWIKLDQFGSVWIRLGQVGLGKVRLPWNRLVQVG
jgi:hypothetical protein